MTLDKIYIYLVILNESNKAIRWSLYIYAKLVLTPLSAKSVNGLMKNYSAL